MYAKKATYTKWVLVPFWIVHTLLMLFMIGVLGYLMLDYAGYFNMAPPG